MRMQVGEQFSFAALLKRTWSWVSRQAVELHLCGVHCQKHRDGELERC